MRTRTGTAEVGGEVGQGIAETQFDAVGEPARRHASTAMLVHSALTSKHTSRPPSASPRPIATEEVPVNVPISIA